jgi:signal peptidase I
MDILDELCAHQRKRLMKKKKMLTAPTAQQLESEIKRVRYKKQYHSVMKSTIYMLITVAAAAILVATLWLPVLQIYGSSMAPTMENGDIVLSVKSSDFRQGDVVAFYYNNKILVKRVIAEPGQWVDITDEGSVYVNGIELAEPYVLEKSFGDTNIELPYQVPDGKVFVMGDHRSTSVDSRNTAVGCVAQEQVVGKIIFRVWPFDAIGSMN